MHRYSEPVLLVLHETKPSWGGMLRNTKDTMEVTAVSLNVLHKRHTRLWSITDVPSDAFRVIAVPGGGGLILTPSLLMYVSQVCTNSPPLLRFKQICNAGLVCCERKVFNRCVANI